MQLGYAVKPTDEEQCRFMMRELSPKQLAPIAVKLGFTGDPVRQSDKMQDFTITTALPHLKRPLPKSVDDLLSALDAASDAELGSK